MTTPIEQRKDLLELNNDLALMTTYRKAILEKLPRAWVMIYHNIQTGNYGLEVTNSSAVACTPEELNEIKEIIRLCKSDTIPVVVKKTRKKKEVVSS